MTTADAFLQSILAEPEDDTLRLIMADWLEENGQPERGGVLKISVIEAIKEMGRTSNR